MTRLTSLELIGKLFHRAAVVVYCIIVRKKKKQISTCFNQPLTFRTSQNDRRVRCIRSEILFHADHLRDSSCIWIIRRKSVIPDHLSPYVLDYWSTKCLRLAVRTITLRPSSSFTNQLLCPGIFARRVQTTRFTGVAKLRHMMTLGFPAIFEPIKTPS